MFERCRQLEGGSTRRFGGTRLALAIAGDFTQLHGGTLDVGDAPEGGALLRAEVPRHAPDRARVVTMAAEDAVVTEAARHSIEALRGRNAARPMAAGEEGRALIVVVEDHPEMNAFICETLADLYRVEPAFDGREGLEKVLELRPDLALSDVMMPEMSGETLVRELRARPERDEMPRYKHTPGVGLGLSLVREMLDAIGGRIELSSAVGMGSTFTVLLPSTAAARRASGRLKTAV